MHSYPGPFKGERLETSFEDISKHLEQSDVEWYEMLGLRTTACKDSSLGSSWSFCLALEFGAMFVQRLAIKSLSAVTQLGRC